MSGDKKRSRSEKKRAQIRTAAYQSFRDHSFNEASVDMICSRASISKGSFYWHYDSKHEVFVDILDTWTREVMDELLQQFEQTIDADDRYDAILAALVREVHRGRAIVPLWLEFTILARRDPQLKIAISRFYRRARAAIGETLRPHTPQLSEVEIQGLAATIFAAYTGLVIQDICDPKWANAEHMLLRSMSVVGRIMQVYNNTPSSPENTTPPKPPIPTAPVEGSRASDADLERLLQSHTHAAQKLTHQLRSLILKQSPHSNERLITGWRVLAYSLPDQKLHAYLKPRRDDVQIGFYQGASLDDPQKLLGGHGKQRRHLNATSLKDIPRDALLALLAGAALND